MHFDLFSFPEENYLPDVLNVCDDNYLGSYIKLKGARQRRKHCVYKGVWFKNSKV